MATVKLYPARATGEEASMSLLVHLGNPNARDPLDPYISHNLVTGEMEISYRGEVPPADMELLKKCGRVEMVDEHPPVASNLPADKPAESTLMARAFRYLRSSIGV